MSAREPCATSPQKLLLLLQLSAAAVPQTDENQTQPSAPHSEAREGEEQWPPAPLLHNPLPLFTPATTCKTTKTMAYCKKERRKREHLQKNKNNSMAYCSTPSHHLQNNKNNCMAYCMYCIVQLPVYSNILQH